MRPFGPAIQFAGSFVELPILSFVSILRPFERAINPSSPNGLLPEYQQILPMVNVVRLMRCLAIAFAPITLMLLSSINSVCRFPSRVASAITSSSSIRHYAKLFKSVTEVEFL
jgi:hypothetical protein